ncbi:MAG: DNA-binding protein [Methanothrix sp.]|nr:MAG: DNA-binding protein [Methanothrix sp.]
MRRSRDKIISEILSVCANGENITRIVYRANTNFTTIRSYLDILIKNGLIESKPGKPTIYKTTQKGQEMMNRLKVLQEELEDIKL